MRIELSAVDVVTMRQAGAVGRAVSCGVECLERGAVRVVGPVRGEVHHRGDMPGENEDADQHRCGVPP
jgi:hypothetical protein